MAFFRVSSGGTTPSFPVITYSGGTQPTYEYTFATDYQFVIVAVGGEGIGSAAKLSGNYSISLLATGSGSWEGVSYGTRIYLLTNVSKTNKIRISRAQGYVGGYAIIGVKL